MPRTSSTRTPVTPERQAWRPARRTVAPPPSRSGRMTAMAKGKGSSMASGLAVTAATAVGGMLFRSLRKRRAQSTTVVVESDVETTRR